MVKGMFNAAQTDNDQRWNHAAQPYMPIARAPASESTSSFIAPMENMTIQGGPSPSPWTPAPQSNGYASSILSAESPCYHPQAAPFAHQPPGGNYHIAPDNYSHRPSSSILSGQIIPGVDSVLCNQTIGRSRGSLKRKNPAIPHLCDMGSTSRYYDVGSSSNLHLPADFPWQEKQNIESHQLPWEYPPGYRVNSLSVGSEGTSRNVRRRTEADVEPIRSTHLSTNSSHHSFSGQSSDQSNSTDFWRQSSNAPTRECNPCLVTPAGQGANFGTVNGYATNGLVESGGYTSSRNHVLPQNANSNLQSMRGIQSGHYVQRSIPYLRASSSSFQPGPLAVSDEGLQMEAESYPSRHHRVFPTIRLRNRGRYGISSDRYRSYPEDASFYNRFTPEGVVVVDHSAFYGSRTLFDHHRDMRLDIDNMSYEDLLVLGERIGSVNTGVSDDLIPKCLTESVYCLSDQLQEHEARCVICLEEYKNMDDVGSLKCGHDFHVGCVKKWLSMKNLCPICKTPAIDDSTKEKLST